MSMDHNNGMAMNDDGTMGGTSPSSPINDNDQMGGMDMGMDNKKMMTHMTFYWGKNAWILFQGWPGSNTGMYILALIFVFLLAIIMEWLTHTNLTPTQSNRMVRTMIHTFRVVFSYLVMLSVMSFNIGVFVVAVLGHAFGYYLFLVLKKSPENDLEIPTMAC
ncbi:copper transporter 1 [Artemisia annua]|uniref:Copper transport protein n=1 Tax=Artemisia annua TaxID=35608 RepID=A0A2U1PX15_ARTAN|nr:copper transporter 1 [Artemisia annua]